MIILLSNFLIDREWGVNLSDEKRAGSLPNFMKISNFKNNKQSDSLIKIIIVEDDIKIRESYVQLINDTDGMTCVGAYNSCEAMLSEINDLLVDVMLMDIGLPGISGIEGIERVKEIYPSVDILVLTVYDDDEKIFQSIYSGASGYILKNENPEKLISAIIEIGNGAPMSAAVAKRVLGFIRDFSNISKIDSFNLTSREMEILQLLVDGMSFKKIAEKLFISPYTVHSHIKRIYEKLHVHSKSEAVSKVLKNKMFLH